MSSLKPTASTKMSSAAAAKKADAKQAVVVAIVGSAIVALALYVFWKITKKDDPDNGHNNGPPGGGGGGGHGVKAEPCPNGQEVFFMGYGTTKDNLGVWHTPEEAKAYAEKQGYALASAANLKDASGHGNQFVGSQGWWLQESLGTQDTYRCDETGPKCTPTKGSSGGNPEGAAVCGKKPVWTADVAKYKIPCWDGTSWAQADAGKKTCKVDCAANECKARS